jgi:hypothetical protein
MLTMICGLVQLGIWNGKKTKSAFLFRIWALAQAGAKRQYRVHGKSTYIFLQ